MMVHLKINSTVVLSIGLFVGGFVFAVTLNEREKQLIDHVIWSIEQAEKGESKISPAVLAVPGMTSPRVKNFLNNLCTLDQATYFEIGVWKGATFTAALFGNKNSLRQAVAMDNWSEFGGPAEEFKANCSLIADVPFNFYNHDCFSISKNGLFDAPVDIYFYDGEHSAHNQERAFTYYNDLFASSFIAVIDDWNFGWVPYGTRQAFNKLGYTILFERELPGKHDATLWWNGLYVAVIRK